MPGRTGCWINNCGEPLVELDGPKKKDDFRACAEHEEELRIALRKLRGDW